MLIGIIGTPNKGKSSLFAALTSNEVKIANYPFTTIDPNKGVAYVTKECVEKELDVKCNARNSLCINSIRQIPINIVDVAGLVEDAHRGKGMGNQFLSDLSRCDAFIVVTDVSGKTNSEGYFCEDNYNPVKDVNIVINELVKWISNIIMKHKRSFKNNTEEFYTLLSSFKIQKQIITEAIRVKSLPTNLDWSGNQTDIFSEYVLKKSKQFIIAANKYDINNKNIEENLKNLKKEFGENRVIECSAGIELALKNAEKQKIIEYNNNNTFEIINKNIPDIQKKGLDLIANLLKTKKTNIQELINKLVFKILNNIVVYPVEDENKYTDHFGNILPDAILIKNTAFCIDLAELIHSNLAKGMLYAINAKTKIKIAKKYLLKDNDVIKIVSTIK